MKKFRILISLGMQENHYQKQQADVALDAGRRLEVEIQILYSCNDAITQSEQLLNAIHAPSNVRPDGILCAPVGTTLASVARCAAENGIGWALLNREGDYLDELRRIGSAPVFFISSDQAEMGRIQGRQIAALLPDGGTILYILGPSASPIVQYRRSFMESTKPANVQMRTLTADWNQQSGYKAVYSWLQLSTSRNAAIDLIAAQCDDTAMGAREAFEANTAGAEKARWTSLPFIGVDGCPGAGRDWTSRGLLTATVVNPPTAGRALEIMVAALRTKALPPKHALIAPSSFPGLDSLGKRAFQRLSMPQK
jgi:ABC-type sugar transport system substrate-binding protein